MTDGTAAPESAHWDGSPNAEDLEQRLQRLEDAVAALCDTQALEERVISRVSEHFAKQPPQKPAPAAPEPPPTASFSPHEPEPESPSFRATVAQGLFSTVSSPDTFSLLGEMWWDLRTFWAMLRDPLYPMTWLGRLVGLLPLAYLLLSTIAGFRNGVLWHLGFVIDLLLFCPFLYVALKVWGRELRRYREFLATRRRR
jgi:hypothetical protein